MRIILDARFLEERGTGIRSYVSGVIGGMKGSNFVQENEVSLIVRRLGNQCGNDFTYIPCDLPVVSIKQRILMPSFLLKERAAIYHYPHFDMPLAPFKKAVITIYDLKYIRMPELFHRQSRMKSYLMRRMMLDSCKRAKRIITISRSSKNDMVNILGIHPEKISVVYCASDPFFHETEGGGDEVLKRYRIEHPFILYVGEIRPHKNIVRLIQAYGSAKIKEYDLVIVGKTYSNYRVPFDLVKEKNLEKRVKFLRYVSKEDLLCLYNRATVFILPSLYEGFGIPVLEAMACGTPVITSNVSSLPEVAGDAAMLIDPYSVDDICESLRALLMDEAKQLKMKQKGFQQLKRFTWTRAANETCAVYERALS